jgi:hypothetical protein
MENIEPVWGQILAPDIQNPNHRVGCRREFGVGMAAIPPPDPEKRSPALSGKERRAKKEKSNKRNRISKAKPKHQGVQRDFFVCDGTALAGRIVECVGPRFEARSPGGETVGIFGSLKEALAALPRALGGGDA